LPLKGDRPGVEHVDWSTAEIVFPKSECLVVITENYRVSDGYTTSTTFSQIIRLSPALTNDAIFRDQLL
jgi:hypothetical protein